MSKVMNLAKFYCLIKVIFSITTIYTSTNLQKTLSKKTGLYKDSTLLSLHKQ